MVTVAKVSPSSALITIVMIVGLPFFMPIVTSSSLVSIVFGETVQRVGFGVSRVTPVATRMIAAGRGSYDCAVDAAAMKSLLDAIRRLPPAERIAFMVADARPVVSVADVTATLTDMIKTT